LPPLALEIGALVLLAFVGVGAILYSWMTSEPGPSGSVRAVLPRVAEQPAAPGEADAPAIDPAATPVAELAAPDPQAPLAGVPMPDLGDPVLSAIPEPEPAAQAVTQRKAAPVLIFDAGNEAAGGGNAADDTKVEILANPIPVKAASSRKAPARVAGTAVLARGTLIPAVLETVIDGAQPGGVRAVVTADVRTHDGSRVLVPRSSRLVGQYRQDGGRAYVIWSRIERPGAGAVSLGPAPAGSDTRFMKRFPAAQVQSVVSGGGATVRVRPGEPVRVYAAGDVPVAPAR
jgi:type IV secretion system protein VirB10